MFRLGLVIAICVLAIDRASKWWVINILELPKIQMVQILPIFNLQWAENRGISFSMLTADSDLGRWALVALTALIATGLVIWLRTVQTRLLAIAIGLVIGGAAGNIYDRAVYGYVADFFQFHTGNWSFAIFNVADSCISIGAALLIWDSFFGPDSRKKPVNKKSPDEG
ncbi:Lipoprotein signal peptidase [hydrothermal vent metagenome]|uniref:Lipoprotein signal peptidase n=1 Tax=hydrothermal vent metagenome TaxID=652676 RepID=A0A3B0SL29_9ZZZZ